MSSVVPEKAVARIPIDEVDMRSYPPELFPIRILPNVGTVDVPVPPFPTPRTLERLFAVRAVLAVRAVSAVRALPATKAAGTAPRILRGVISPSQAGTTPDPPISTPKYNV
jgi:hypothetical protein